MPERLLALCMARYRARERRKQARIKAENIAEEPRWVNEAMARGMFKAEIRFWLAAAVECRDCDGKDR